MIDDPSFIDVIVQELKSQGLFDQFRKECLADVDTKPAYQNLRQRVEGNVGKFLVPQEWSDNIRYKNQLRDQLRKYIIDAGFLDTGVERIVDQVVNPKISTVFQPKVEEIVYNYLGIEKPKSSVNGNESKPELLLDEDLEAVSPDSDKKSEASATSPLPAQVTENPEEDMDIEDMDEELDESKEQDDFESPAFEPLEVRSPSKTKDETNDSNSSAISGLTSQESVESDDKRDEHTPDKPVESTNVPPSDELENPTTKDSDFSQEMAPNNDSQLSQVSSNSQLLTTTMPSVGEEPQRSQENERLDITEEAQMPTLFTSAAGKSSESTEAEDGSEDAGKKTNFNFEKDEYDFVGTGRSSVAVCDDDNSSTVNVNQQPDKEEAGTPTETPTETVTETPTKDSQVPSFSTQDDTTSQSEHSLKICEDTFSDDDTKEGSRSTDARQTARGSPPNGKELSDASSCSFKSEPDAKSKPASPKNKSGERPRSQQSVELDEGREEKKKTDEAEDQPKKTPKSDAEDDHYQEHLKQTGKRRSSDRDSDDSNDKAQPPEPPASSAESKPAEEKTANTQEASDGNPEKEKSNDKSAGEPVESPERRRDFGRAHGSVTPSRVDSSSSGIQSGDDSEKSPESIKTFAKSESIVLPVQPVVIDQMLTIVEDSQLERLLNGDTPTNDATLESLQRQWQSADGRVRKPKFASNFSEARRLMKVRKQMQREEQKCREQTMAMAKKYITENKSFGGQMAEDQGIELEFVCDGKRKSPGPMISSPVPRVEPTEDVQPAADPELLYFPEKEEVFRVDEAQLNFLRSKIDGLTFGRSFKVEHYRTKIYSLAVPTAVKRTPKRTASRATESPKNKRSTSVVLNGIGKEYDLSADNNGAALALGKQRSIRSNASQRLVEKNTPPSVGSDA